MWVGNVEGILSIVLGERTVTSWLHVDFFEATLTIRPWRESVHKGSDLKRMFFYIPVGLKVSGLVSLEVVAIILFLFGSMVERNGWLYSRCPSDMSTFLSLFMSVNKHFVHTSAMGWMRLFSFNLA